MNTAKSVLGSLTLCVTMTVVAALDPGQPPGGNFDLRHWKLTLPDTNATEVASEELAEGYTNAAYFYTAPDGSMVLFCPVTGGVTDGSSYPRCELRELLDPDNENVNWPGFGTHILNARCRVLQVPGNRRVIIGQIHAFTGSAAPLVKLLFDDGWVEAQVNESPAAAAETVFSFGNIGLGNPISFQLKFTEGLLSVTVNGSNQSMNVFQTGPAWMPQKFYFKAGSYCQDNSGLAEEGSTVAFSELGVEHRFPAADVPVITLTNWIVHPDGRLNFSTLVPGGQNYFIQTSTDLVHWRYLLITNSASDRIDFTDSMRAGVRFYRGGVFSTATIINTEVDAGGHLGFTLIGPGAGNYFIQSSTDLMNWEFLLITNAPLGRVHFRDPDPVLGSEGRHFYRGGSF